MGKLLQGDELEQRAGELGVDIQGDALTQSSSGRRPRADDAELQRRVLDAERSIRESRLWLLALLSALASVVSAIAAWVAAVKWERNRELTGAREAAIASRMMVGSVGPPA